MEPTRRKKFNILNYYDMKILNPDGVSMPSPDGRIRGVCRLCSKTYSGTMRVKSNFIAHLRKMHPLAYNNFCMATGKPVTLSLASLNDNPLSIAVSSSSMVNQLNTVLPAHIGSSCMNDSKTIDTTTASSANPCPPVLQQIQAPAGSVPPHSLNAVLQFVTGNVCLKAYSSPLSFTCILSTYTFADDLVPLHILDSPRFIGLVGVSPTGLRLDTAVTRERLSTARELLNSKMAAQLEAADHIWLSGHRWQSDCTHLEYLSLNAHFLSGWQYKHMALCCKKLERSAGDNSLGQDVSHQLDELRIKHKTVGLVTGLLSVPSLSGTGRQQLRHIDGLNNQLISFNTLLGTILYSSIKEVSEETLDLVKKVRKLAPQLGIALPTFHGFDEQSWDQQLKCLDEISSSSFGSMDLAVGCELTDVEHKQLTSLLACACPLREVAQRMNSCDSITGSMVIPSIKVLQASVEEVEKFHPESELARVIGEKLAKELVSEYLSEKALQMSTMMDPRFKLQWCDCEDRETLRQMLISELQAIEIADDVINTRVKPDSTPALGFFSKILQQEPQATAGSRRLAELYRYLDEPLVAEESDPLQYWLMNESKLPHLSQLAKKYLALPMSVNNVRYLYRVPNETFSMETTPLEGSDLESAMLIRSNRNLPLIGP